MNPLVELNLALILFLPWYLILGVLFWRYRPRPVSTRGRLFDAAALLLALLAAAIGGWWSFRHADAAAGAIWRQVLASVVGYGMFLLVLTIAFLGRRSAARRGAAAGG
jgi:hypothetical protein